MAIPIRVEETIKNLKKNNMAAYYCETKEEVVPLIKTLVEPGATVSNGGSVTLSETGVIDLLSSGDYNYIDRSKAKPEEIRDVYLKALGADAYFCSSNAVTQNGELYNVDGNSNRVASIVFGPKKVIMVVGINKIVRNVPEAALRVKMFAAPKNTKRLDCNTYCKTFGQCVSTLSYDSQMCDGCDSDERICCSYVVSAKQRIKNRINVIIVNEELGY